MVELAVFWLSFLSLLYSVLLNARIVIFKDQNILCSFTEFLCEGDIKTLHFLLI